MTRIDIYSAHIMCQIKYVYYNINSFGPYQILLGKTLSFPFQSLLIVSVSPLLRGDPHNRAHEEGKRDKVTCSSYTLKP